MDDSFLREDGFDAYRIAFGEEQFYHLSVLGLQSCIFVMHDVPKVLRESVRRYRDQACRACFHQFARNTVIAGDDQKTASLTEYRPLR